MSGYLAVEAAIRDAPTDWTRTTFKRITTQFKVPNTASDEPLLSLASTGVVSARLEMGGLGRQAPSDETIKSYWRVRPDQVVVNPMWLVGGSVGVSDVTGAVSPAYRVYQVIPGVHPRFIHHLLRTYPFMEQYRLLGRGDTTFDRSVGREDFEDLPVALPPLDEQRRIADFLDDQVARLDRAIELRQRQMALTGERMGSELNSIYTSGVAGTTATPLLRLLLQGPRYGVLVPRLSDEGVPFIRISDLNLLNRGDPPVACIPPEQSVEYRRTVVVPGDVLTSVVGTLGTSAIVPKAAAGANVARAVCLLRPRKDVPSWYLFGWLSTPEFLAMAQRSTGAGTAQATLNMGDLAKFSVPVPASGGLNVIAHSVQRLFDQRDHSDSLMHRGLDLLRDRRQALITAAVTGQFDVATARSVA